MCLDDFFPPNFFFHMTIAQNILFKFSPHDSAVIFVTDPVHRTHPYTKIQAGPSTRTVFIFISKKNAILQFKMIIFGH